MEERPLRELQLQAPQRAAEREGCSTASLRRGSSSRAGASPTIHSARTRASATSRRHRPPCCGRLRRPQQSPPSPPCNRFHPGHLIGAASSRPSTFDISPSFGQRAHLFVEIGLSLESDAFQRRKRDVALLDLHPVRKPTEWLEKVGVGFAARVRGRRRCSETSDGRHGECAARRPAVLAKHVERAEIFDRP